MKKEFFTEAQLAALAKKFRQKSGKNKSEAAREFSVHRATISLAENKPKQSLTLLRIRMIQSYSQCNVIGPVFFLEKHKS